MVSKFSINFENEEQYNKFIQSIRDEVIKEIKPVPNYSSDWIDVRKQMEERFRKDNFAYSKGCGWWHTQMTSLYAVFRLAFQQPTVRDLRDVDGERIKNLHDELFELIDKYRSENKWKLSKRH